MAIITIKRDIGSINDGGRKLKVGTHKYKITGADMPVKKGDPKGKERQVVFTLADGDYVCKVFLDVMSGNDVQREIAQKSLVAFADATGLGGDLKLPDRLPSFIGKFVVITARETAGKGENKDKTFVNLVTVEAPEDEEDEEEGDEAPAPAPKAKGKKPAPAPVEDEDEDDDEEESDDEDDSEEEEEEEAPTPAKAGKAKRPW